MQSQIHARRSEKRMRHDVCCAVSVLYCWINNLAVLSTTVSLMVRTIIGYICIRRTKNIREQESKELLAESRDQQSVPLIFSLLALYSMQCISLKGQIYLHTEKRAHKIIKTNNSGPCELSFALHNTLPITCSIDQRFFSGEGFFLCALLYSGRWWLRVICKMKFKDLEGRGSTANAHKLWISPYYEYKKGSLNFKPCFVHHSCK